MPNYGRSLYHFTPDRKILRRAARDIHTKTELPASREVNRAPALCIAPVAPLIKERGALARPQAAVCSHTHCCVMSPLPASPIVPRTRCARQDGQHSDFTSASRGCSHTRGVPAATISSRRRVQRLNFYRLTALLQLAALLPFYSENYSLLYPHPMLYGEIRHSLVIWELPYTCAHSQGHGGSGLRSRFRPTSIRGGGVCRQAR